MIFRVPCIFAVALSLACLVVAEENRPPDGFRALFNGRDLSGWHGMQHVSPRKLAAMTDEERAKMRSDSLADVNAHWRVEDGELINDGHGLYLTTDELIGDAEIWVDYKTVPKADSGIYLRSTPQVQIWDTTEAGGKWNIGADKGSGGLWNNSKGAPGKDPLVLADKPFGEWNRVRIIQVGSRTTVYLNDKLVVDHAIMENWHDRKLPLAAKGSIQLQTHGGAISWRNIFVRDIPAEEANALLASKNNDGFESVFNGKDLTGWAGAVDSYEVVDGAIACKPGKGGNLYTKEEYQDFAVRLEFKLPPGGNNGLSIRYPGQGDTAYVGMTELQVLDSAAHRGYLRETGEWNFQEVTVKGSTIVVELNGTVILDVDLSKITEYMANRPHPGKTNERGHFGFAGHGDAVQFRNVSIKKL